MSGTNDVVEPRWFFYRPRLGAIILCILAFGASSQLPYRALSHWTSSTFAIALLLNALVPALREVSEDVQRWARIGGALAAGAAFGLFLRLIMR